MLKWHMNHIISLTVVKKYWSLWSLRYIDGKKNVRPFSFFFYIIIKIMLKDKPITMTTKKCKARTWNWSITGAFHHKTHKYPPYMCSPLFFAFIHFIHHHHRHTELLPQTIHEPASATEIIRENNKCCGF